MHLSLIAIIGVMFVQGCGPLVFPMVVRPEAQQQAEIDAAWNNMLKPANRLDRETLLDCVVMMQLYQAGIDRFSAKSIKKTSAGTVEMSINFDRTKPQSDQFVLRVVGAWGKTLRQEKWSAKELFSQYGMDDSGHVAPVAANDHDQQELQLHQRLARFQAATQPWR